MQHHKMKLIMGLLLGILLISFASAATQKEFEKNNPNKYGKEKIKDHLTIDIFGWFDNPLADYTINYSTDTCAEFCFTEGFVLVHEKGTIFDDISLYDEKRDKKDKKNTIFIYKNKTTINTYPTYAMNCSMQILNGTLQDSCIEIINGTREQSFYEEFWQEYKKEELDPGIYRWRIEVLKAANENIDMVPIAYGLELHEWVWYNASLTHKRNITSITSRIINVSYFANLNPDYSDFNFINWDDATTRGMFMQTPISGSSAIIHISNNSDGNIYYTNATQTTSPSNVNNVYPGLKFWYPFDESSGTASAQILGASANLSTLGGTWKSGKILNGYMPNAECKDTGLLGQNFQSSGRAFSISFWVNRSATITGYPSYIGNAGSSGVAAHQFKCFSNGDDVACYLKGTGGLVTLDGSTTLPLGRFAHVVLEYNGTTAQLFVNGVQDSTATDATINLDTSGINMYLFCAGQQSGTSIGNNLVAMDDVRFYNHSLSTTELLDLNNSFVLGTYSLGDEQSSVINPTLSAAISYPSNNANFTTSTPSLACNFSTNVAQNVSSVKINVYDSSNNLDYSDIVGSLTVNSYNKTWTTSALTDDTYKFECFGFGSKGVNATTGNYTIGIDANAPSVVINFPTATTYTYNVSNISYTASDQNLKSCWFSNNSGATNASLTCNQTYYINVSDGSYTWRIYSNDSYGNLGQSSVSFNVNTQPTGGLITLNLPIDNTYSNNNSQNFTWTFAPLQTNLTNSTFYLWNNATGALINSSLISYAASQNSTINSSVLISSIPEGTLKWNVKGCVKTNAGANNCTMGASNYSFITDYTNPIVDIVYPVDGANYTTLINSANYTINDANPNKCWYSLNDGALNSSASNAGLNFTSVSFAQGTNTIKVYCNDTIGNLGNHTHTFFIDSIKPTIDFVSPTPLNGTRQTSRNLSIAVNATDTNNLASLTLRFYNSSNYLLSSATTTSKNITLALSNLSDDDYKINATAIDIYGNINSTDTRIISIDNRLPIINITYLAGINLINYSNQSQSSFIYNATLNYTAQATGSALSSCYYNTNLNLTNVSISCTANTTQVTGLRYNTFYTIYLYSNDSLNNIGVAQSNISQSALYELSYNYTRSIYEGLQDRMSINVSFNNNSYSSIAAILVYNNTNYAAFQSTNNEIAQFYYNLQVPQVDSSQNFSFYWLFSLTNTTAQINISSPSFSQQVNELSLDTCSSNSYQILNYTLKDEASQSTAPINISREIEIDVLISSWLNSSVFWNVSGTFRNSSNVAVCVPSDIFNSSNAYRLDVTNRFFYDNHVVEYQYIQAYNLTSQNNPQYINLMDLDTPSSQSFLVSLYGCDYLPIENAIVRTWRYYVGEGQFKEVEGSKTNNEGQTVTRLVLEDAIYKFYAWKENQLILATPEYQATCQSSVCQFNLRQECSASNITYDYTKVNNLYYLPIVNASTKSFRVNFQTSDGSSTNLNLTVYDINGTSVCSSAQTSSGGTIPCLVNTTLFENKTYQYVIRQNGKIIKQDFASMDSDIDSNADTSTNVFLTIGAIIALTGAAASSAIGVVVWLALAIILSSILLLSIPYAGITLLVVAIGIVIWKAIKRGVR